MTRTASRFPGIAPAAKQMGRYVGRLIAARLGGKAVPAVPLLRPWASSRPSDGARRW